MQHHCLTLYIKNKNELPTYIKGQRTTTKVEIIDVRFEAFAVANTRKNFEL
jgi:hypothetical protein